MTAPKTRRQTQAAASADGVVQDPDASGNLNAGSNHGGNVETVTSDPVLVGNGRYSEKLKRKLFEAVDYLSERFRVGDHVSMYNIAGNDWVCVIEYIYFDETDKIPKFRGRWFWTVEDVSCHKHKFKQMMRPSKCTSHEFISSDNRDDNLVESIRRKCYILSWTNFQLVKKYVSSHPDQYPNVYFCDRQFYHKAYRFNDLDEILFPGDLIPAPLRKAVGLPPLVLNSNNASSLQDGGNVETNSSSNPNDPVIVNEGPLDLSYAYYEPEYTGKMRHTKKNKVPTVSSYPFLLW